MSSYGLITVIRIAHFRVGLKSKIRFNSSLTKTFVYIAGVNKLTKLGRCDRETIELANNSNDSIVRTAGRTSK